MQRYHKMTTLACYLTFALGSLSATAQQASDSERRPQTDLGEIRRVSKLLETNVSNQANEEISRIKDLILTPDGTPLYAVLSRGGVAGIGASYYPVPWEKLDVRHTNGKWVANLGMTKQALEKAPTFQQDGYQDLTNEQFVDRVHEFFGAQTPGTTQPADTKTPGHRAVQLVIRASKVLEAKLQNNQNENLGKVEDLLMDHRYRVVFAIVGRGGILDIGERYIPVPWSKLRLNINREYGTVTAVLDTTKQFMEKAPLVEGENYATLLGQGFVAQVYRYFGVTQ